MVEFVAETVAVTKHQLFIVAASLSGVGPPAPSCSAVQSNLAWLPLCPEQVGAEATEEKDGARDPCGLRPGFPGGLSCSLPKLCGECCCLHSALLVLALHFDLMQLCLHQVMWARSAKKQLLCDLEDFAFSGCPAAPEDRLGEA